MTGDLKYLRIYIPSMMYSRVPGSSLLIESQIIVDNIDNNNQIFLYVIIVY